MNTDLQDALIAWQGGELPEGRAEALLEKLRMDASFRQVLAEQVWTLSLTKIAQSPDPRWIALHEEIGLIEQRFDVIDGGFESTLMKTVRREPLRFVGAGWRWAAGFAAAAAVVLAGLLLFQTQVVEHDAETLAVLVPASAEDSSRAVHAGRLRLPQGQARLLFTSGVILDVEGPADLDLLSVSRVLCREGRLRTQVPRGAEGFCVETPRGAVTDLGTVLGISVTKSGQTDVSVIEGQAELSTRIPGQSGLRTAVLDAHEKASFGSSSGVIGSSDETDFLQPVQPAVPRLRLPADYVQRILAAKPAHYWRLNRQVDGKVPNEIAGASALLITGEVEISDSACFRGKDAPGVLHMEAAWETPAGGYAIEFWFMPEQLGQMAISALTTPEPMRPHLSLVEIGGRQPGATSGTGVLRYLLRWPPGHRDGMNLYSPTTAALPFQWHHVVAQQQAGRMELYLDGTRLGPAQADDVPRSHEALLQLGALEFRPGQELSKLRRPFSGRISEVAIYDRALEDTEVREHSQRRPTR